MTTFFLRSPSRLAAAVAVIVALCLALAGAASAKSRIFNGENAAPSDHPAQVALLDPNDDDNNFCGGTLVNATHVLTAAHCVKEAGQPVTGPDDLTIGIGSTNLNDVTNVDVLDVAVYPGYDGADGERNDVAVLELAESTTIAPTSLVAASADNPWEYLVGTVFGWGAIDNQDGATGALKKLVYQVQPDEACEGTLGPDSGFEKESMLCAADSEGIGYGGNGNYSQRRVICSGDSGGPLLVPEGGKLAVAGVVSWSIGEKSCDNDTGIDVYGRIGAPAINAWVREQIAPDSGLIDPIIENPGRRPSPPVTTSTAVSRDLAVPRLGSLSVSNKTFAVDPKGSAEKPVASAKKGTTFRYRLSENARVVFLVEKIGKGRKSGKKCVKQTKGNRKKGKCTRYTKAGAFAQSGRAGANSKAFSGRIGSKKLSPGKYRVTLTATDAARNKSKVSSVTLTVVRR